MTIDKNVEGSQTQLKISGRLDTSTAPELEATIDNCLSGVEELIMDFEGLEYVSSAGLRVILKAQKLMNKQGSMKIVNVNDTIMEVFDITELGTGKKTKLKKINVDYDTAIERGYRIVDASAHNWMHNAHQAGNGTVPLETYTAFEKENYGIYDDASWYEGIDEAEILQKNLLKAPLHH